ncbi:MAG: Dihydroorotate dehydrogenase (quinone) [Chloroflexi bacterium ADurb.Bin325]|nr:MAG: Dihydroorotate dehydrogenase (quinone) [Chloroflexi bacterium ADurb.Bin325]
MYGKLRPLIFRLPPEAAHGLTVALLRLAGALPPARALLRALFAPRGAARPVHACGLTFPNAVGLAAGYDKDGLAWRGLAALPFGHLELGTVTPRPQPGNPRPRVFRLVEDEAVINRMGFPGRGADALARRLKGRGRRADAPLIGVNIGKNKDTRLEDAAADYVALARRFAPLADYLAVNVSSPNTPGLRTLQGGDALDELLRAIGDERDAQARLLARPVPVLVKLAPDLDEAALEQALSAICAAGMDGVIISNTTVARPGLTSRLAAQTGGLSGRPLCAPNTALVRRTAALLDGRLPIIASGGILRPADAQEKLDAGASLVQLYTGLIYAGPGLVGRVVEATARG